MDKLLSSETSRLFCVEAYKFTGNQVFINNFYTWNDIMFLINEIELIDDPRYGKFSVFIQRNECTIYSEFVLFDKYNRKKYISDPNAIFDSKIESTVYNLYKFLKFYNEYKNISETVYVEC